MASQLNVDAGGQSVLDAAQGQACSSADCGLQLSTMVPWHDGKTDMRACSISSAPLILDLLRPKEAIR